MSGTAQHGDDRAVRELADHLEDNLRRQGGFGSSAADRMRDLRLAFRGLARCPLFTGVAVFVLALGIGASVAIGLMLAPGLIRLMSTLLYGVSPVDPVTFVVVAIGLLGVALLASYLPARRAAGIDPMNALRVD